MDGGSSSWRGRSPPKPLQPFSPCSSGGGGEHGGVARRQEHPQDHALQASAPWYAIGLWLFSVLHTSCRLFAIHFAAGLVPIFLFPLQIGSRSVLAQIAPLRCTNPSSSDKFQSCLHYPILLARAEYYADVLVRNLQ